MSLHAVRQLKGYGTVLLNPIPAAPRYNYPPSPSRPVTVEAHIQPRLSIDDDLLITNMGVIFC